MALHRLSLALGCALAAAACNHGSDAAADGDGGSVTKGDDLDDGTAAVDPKAYDFRTDAIDDYDEVVDAQGIAFADTILGRRANHFSEIGAHNADPATLTTIVVNFADLAVAFGRDFRRMGFDTCADLDRVDVERTSEKPLSLFTAFRVIRRCMFQPIRPEHGALSLRPMDVFVPNHLKIDFRLVADGSESRWPNGQRPDEQLASIFTGLLLDLDGGVCEDDQGGPDFDGVRDRPCTAEILQDGGPSAYWDLPLNPVTNDVEFVRSSQGRLAFPYLPGPHRR
ncbi:MAG: hypothetical protein U0168_26820 [Nannocystaceae bacterium]